MELPKCKACEDEFEEFDDVVEIEDDVYHEKCLEKYPKGYVYFLDDAFMGDEDDYPAAVAYDVFENVEWDKED